MTELSVPSSAYVQLTRTSSFPSVHAVADVTGNGASVSFPTMSAQLSPTRTSSKSAYPWYPDAIRKMLATLCVPTFRTASKAEFCGSVAVGRNCPSPPEIVPVPPS